MIGKSLLFVVCMLTPGVAFADETPATSTPSQTTITEAPLVADASAAQPIVYAAVPLPPERPVFRRAAPVVAQANVQTPLANRSQITLIDVLFPASTVEVKRPSSAPKPFWLTIGNGF